MGKIEQIQLLAKMENVLHISNQDRLTTWFGDYGVWETRPGVTMRQVNERIHQLDAKMEHTPSVKVQVRELRTRTIEVENASSIEEAVSIVQELYDQKGIHLNKDEVEEVKIRGMEQVKNKSLTSQESASMDYSRAVEEVMAAADIDSTPEIEL